VDARGEAAALVGASDPMMADTQEVLPVAAREAQPGWQALSPDAT